MEVTRRLDPDGTLLGRVRGGCGVVCSFGGDFGRRGRGSCSGAKGRGGRRFRRWCIRTLRLVSVKKENGLVSWAVAYFVAVCGNTFYHAACILLLQTEEIGDDPELDDIVMVGASGFLALILVAY